ncbi:MAG: HAD hydrolase family protein [Bacteroidetes bacterium]|nr:HAD hydrolase family protein [Bacteroidota bacterium]
MLTLDIPGRKPVEAEHLVLDYNGTLAVDGCIIQGVADRLKKLSSVIRVHVLTADTFGTAEKELRGIPVILQVIEKENQASQKLNYVTDLGPDKVISIGNGRNDILMLKGSALSIGVIQAEGAYSQIINNVQIICTSIIDALSLLTNENRLIATLRN